MEKIKMRARERNMLRDMGNDVLDLRADWNRRLINALLALSQSDPRWMVWIEHEVQPESMGLEEITRLVEARARVRVLKAYNYFGHQCIGDLIFRDTWTFTDRGNLGPG